jgi:hypothetical protein
MAIVKFGGGVAGIRGTLAGNVFTANRNGAYVRQWSRVHNPKTLFQTVNRMSASLIPTAWRNLDPGQRLDWNDYGKTHVLQNALGEDYYRTGFQWFFHCSQNLSVCGGTPPTDAPTVAAPATVACTLFSYDDAGFLGNCTVYFDSADFAGLWLVFMFRPIPYSGNMSCPSGYTRIGGVYEPAGGQVNATIPHNFHFGNPQVGWRGFVRIYTMDTQGLRSAPWAASADYTIL